MAVNPGRVRQNYLYGWLEKPSYVTGAASTFDFLGIWPWWNGRRFRSDADAHFLADDFLRGAADFRRSYYRCLHEAGVEPPNDEPPPGQIAFFDADDFLARR